MMIRNRRRIAVGAAALVFVGGVLSFWNRHRTIPIERALNPAYWVRHARGLDRYDPQTALLEHGDPNLPEVALTIDDGPDPRYGPQIAQMLHDKGVAATFFVVGIRVKQYPEVIKKIDSLGFEIQNHTYDHQRLDTLKPHEIANEIRFCAANVEKVTGKKTNLLRPPGVQYNDQTLATAKALGYVTVSWTCGARDYDQQPASYIAQRILDRTEAGSIIILHQDTPGTLAALPQIIDGLRARGYRFVTVSQMLEHLHAQRPA
ncbi:MAG: polysaccharide deacetylase family protein [Capsulimonas sp.]|uniref:polysaccharide deacetylase family protein n=1 Tax=Capsulimonas sp. TaxID=2494211 RepID=UPI0032672BFB